MTHRFWFTLQADACHPIETNYSEDMKANRLASAFVLIFAVAVQLPAQHAEAERKHFEEIRGKAEKGDATAQCELGKAYYLGRTVPQNYAEAVNRPLQNRVIFA
jgi:TPR repeat protein